METLPIPMLLFCPCCGEQHVDKPQPDKGWTNPPHRSHECQCCSHVWRPCDRPTTGVEAIETKGSRDKPARPTDSYRRRIIRDLHAIINRTLDNTDEALDHLDAFGAEVITWCDSAAELATDQEQAAVWRERASELRKAVRNASPLAGKRGGEV